MREKLEAAALLAEAERQTGLSDWGGEEYFEDVFRRLYPALVHSVEEEAHLHDRGHEGAAMRLRDIASMRLRFIDDRKKWPEIRKESIARPLVIMGLPRAGTTFLQTLIAQDPDNRVTKIWEMMLPSPPPEAATYASDPRIARAQAVLDAMGQTRPEVYGLHPFSAELPEETHHIEEMVVMGDNLRAAWHLPGYNKLRAAVDMGVAYRIDRMVMQNLQYRNRRKRWVLKGPGYVFYLKQLLEVFPDAILVQTHRDPVRIVPSVAGLLLAIRGANTDVVPTEEVRHKTSLGNVKAFAAGLKSVTEYRDACADKQRFFDVHFTGLMADPVGTVREIYRHFAMELNGTAEQRMRAWLATPESKGATVRHKPEDYGLDEATVERYFGEYIDRYGVKRERSVGTTTLSS